MTEVRTTSSGPKDLGGAMSSKVDPKESVAITYDDSICSSRTNCVPHSGQSRDERRTS